MAEAIAMNTMTDVRPEPVKGRMPSWVAALLLVACAASIIALLTWQWISQDMFANCQSSIGDLFGANTCGKGISKIVTYLWILAVFPFMMLLERAIPADPDQPMFSPGMLVDLMWVLTFPLLGVWLPNVFSGFLSSAFGTALEGLRLKALATLPLPAQLLLVILVADFLAYFGHLLRHKIPTLWEFHKIHHSQVQLNYFSTRRIHPLDTLAQSLISFLPWTLLGLSTALPGFLVWSTFLRLYEMFVHANLRINMGPLRYILVTPQSHRIHHSLYDRHIDTNYGDFLSVWDWIFGTQVRRGDEYPPLGVTDKQCPEGVSSSVGGAIGVFLKELVYPLKALAGLNKRSGSAAEG